MPYRDPEARRAYKREYARKYRAERPEDHKAAIRKYAASHREELNARARQYRAEHPGEAASAWRKYRATDAGYAMHRAAGSRVNAARRVAVLDPELTNAILAQILCDGETCAWCRNSVPLRERMIDHRRAICFGGAHTADNIQILCKSCEKQKSVAERSLARKLRNGITKADFVLAA